MPHRARIIQLFDSVAKAYDAWYAQPAGRVVLETEARMLGSVLPAGVGAEVGAGTCVFAQVLSRDREILCCDPSLEMLELGRERCPHVLASTAEEPPLRPRSLDFAYLVTVIEFLKEPGLALAQLSSLVRRGGVLAVLFIERQSRWGRLYEEVGRRGEDPVLASARLYSFEEVEDILRRSGLRVRRVLQALDYEPLSVPSEEPKIYEGLSCADCGVTLIAAEPQ
ncbi:MAG: class I SAM-dependent methyltransferase [Thermofilum sp.]